MALPKRPPSQNDDPPRHDAAATEPDWHALYDIESLAEVDAYVGRYPIVASILAEAPAEVASTFDEEPHLILRREVDPEDEPATDYLVVDIVTRRDANDAHDRLNCFDERWWLDAMSRAARAGAIVVFYPRFA